MPTSPTTRWPCLPVPQQTPLWHPGSCSAEQSEGELEPWLPRWGEVQLEGEGGSQSFPPPPPQPLTGCSWACPLLSSLLPPPSHTVLGGLGSGFTSPYSSSGMALTVDVVGPAPWGFRITGGRDFHTPIMVTKVRASSRRLRGIPCPTGRWLCLPGPHRYLSLFCSGTRGLLLGVLVQGGLGPCCLGDGVARSGAGFWVVKGSWAKGPADCQPHTCW